MVRMDWGEKLLVLLGCMPCRCPTGSPIFMRPSGALDWYVFLQNTRLKCTSHGALDWNVHPTGSQDCDCTGCPNRMLTIYFPLTGPVEGLLLGIFILTLLMFNFQAKVIKAANRRGAGRKRDCHRKCVILLPLIVFFFRFKTFYWNLAYKLLFVNSTFFKFLEYLKIRPDLKMFLN